MTLSKQAAAMLELIAQRRGGIIPEWLFRDKLKLCHGSFVAGRRELLQSGLIECSKNGRKTVYHLTDLRDCDKIPVIKGHSGLKLMPVVDGKFKSVEDWEANLTIRVGNADFTETNAPNIYRVSGVDYTLPRNYYVFSCKEGVQVCALMGGSFA